MKKSCQKKMKIALYLIYIEIKKNCNKKYQIYAD